MDADTRRLGSALVSVPRVAWPSLPDLPALRGPTIPAVGRSFYLYSENTVLKLGAHEEEAVMTGFARGLLGHCVPEAKAVVTIGEKINGILLGRIRGQPLKVVWPSLDAAQQAIVKRNLRDVLVRLRTPQFDYIGRPGRRPFTLFDEFGPHAHAFCDTHEQWDRARIAALNEHADASSLPRLVERQSASSRGGHRAVLTHGDLSDGNILVDADSLEITGLIDWEMANVAPTYFEYVAARLAGGHLPEWRKVLLEVLQMVLRFECSGGDVKTEEAGASEDRYRQALHQWKELVDVERVAQGFGPDCYWTFEEPTTPGLSH